MAYQPPATPTNEKQRLQSLLDTGLLDSAAEERFDRITRLTQQLLNTPIALVSLVDENRQWFKSKQGLDASETGRDISFCGHAILSDAIFEISDTTKDKRFAENPLVTDGPLIRFYAGAPLHAKSGYRIGTLCVIDDKPRQLDDQQRANLRDLADCVEAEIHRNQLAELQNIIEGTRVGTWEWNVQTGETVFNERWAEIVGYTLAELAPMNIETWSRLIHPDDRKHSEQLLEKCFNKQQDYYDCKVRMRHKDGHWVWVHNRGKVSAWTDDDKPLIMSGTHADISEMMEAMESAKSANTWLNAVMDSANLAIVTANNEAGIIHNFNTCAERLLGYTADEIIDKQSPAIFHDIDEVVERAKVLSRELKTPIEPGFEVFVAKTRLGMPDENEWTYIHKNGDRIPVSLSVTAVRNDANEIIGYLGISRDISEQKAAQKALKEKEQTLIKAKEAAEVAAKAKSEFLANMSHEIRTPMNGVIGMLKLALKSHDLPQDVVNQIGLAQSSAKSLLVIINDILDFSKIDAGKLELESIEFDLPEMLSEFTRSMAYQAEKKGLHLILDAVGITVHKVIGDPSRLRQILYNLVGNATKFTEAGEVLVRARLTEHNAHQWQLECEIKDTGIGIEANKLERLFEAFSQADSSTTRQFGGTGLGLSIVKRLCYLMGGDIHAESTLGKGSRFKFRIRLNKTQKTETRLPILAVNNLQILAIETHTTRAAILQEQLESWGAKVTTINNTENFQKHLDQPYDIALIDCQLQDSSPQKICKKLKAGSINTAIKLVLMSHITSQYDSNQIAEMGFDGFFNKPATPSDLFDVLMLVANTDRDLSHTNAVDHRGSQLAKQNHKADSTAPFRVLLVEDNMINQEVAKGLLEDIGIAVDCAENGAIALEKLKQDDLIEPYELILMDCQMPIMDGYETSKHIRAGAAGDYYQNTPIIALTANAMQGDQALCLAAGMTDYLSKPIDDELLEEKVLFYLNRSNTTGKRRPYSGNHDANRVSIWDKEALLKRVRGKEHRALELINMYLSTAEERVAALIAAVDAEDFEKSAQLAHSIKGSVANLGGIQMQALTTSIEQAAINHERDLMQDYVTAMKQVSHEFVLALRNHLQQD